ncbi:MAG: bifunctional copper resistance protein CopD/cytochrome c oxidase assembly protein [Actinobacteria bacterium]|nr:bifunctional copper resistance protein CopD/cytochrome c oxidase assembly protein [Actinomycetota bacterium]
MPDAAGPAPAASNVIFVGDSSADSASIADPAGTPEPTGAAANIVIPAEKTGRRWRAGAVVITAALVTACIAAALAAIVPARQEILGLPDAGEFTQLALPAVTGLFDMMAAVTIGWLLGAAALAPPQRSGIVDVGGYRCLRAASLAAMVWAASAVALVPLIVADALGRPILQSLDATTMSTAIGVLADARGALIAGGIAVVIAIAARVVMRVTWAFVLLALALFALVPVALGGHAGISTDHDFAVDSMIYHLFGASLWIGGLVALIGLAKQHVRHIEVVARRYSTLALVAIVAVAASGVINAKLRVPGPSEMWSTAYGRMVAAKILLVLLLGVVGYLHRRRTLPQIRDNGDARPLIRLAAVEIVIMAVTVGVAATLSRTATPPLPGIVPSNEELVLGFDLPGPPSIRNLTLFWRFDLIAGTAAVAAAVLYLVGVWRLRRRGDAWPAGRTIAWVSGCAVLLWSTSSGMGAYGQAVFSMHMIEHMLLAMLVPILLALGGPVTLLMRALPAAGRDDPPGLREAVVGFVHSPFTRFLTHPLVALTLFVASFYGLYFTDLFDVMISSHPGHLFMEIHFLLTGYLFYWVVIGVDPSPRQLSSPVKLAVVLASLPFHAFFGLALMSSHHLLGADFFQRLALPWVGNLLDNQQLGGGIGWGFTEIPLLIVMIALMAQWARSDERTSRQLDRRAEITHDADLTAYNAMLARMAERDQVNQR